jgi:nitrogen fixation NifU-like protein
MAFPRAPLAPRRPCRTIAGVYPPRLLDHFEHPRHVGEIERPDASAQLENPACGDLLHLTLRVADGQILEARYRAKGCVATIACGSALAEMLTGMSLSAALRLPRAQIAEAVGGLPPASTHASHLAIDALRAALKQIARK